MNAKNYIPVHLSPPEAMLPKHLGQSVRPVMNEQGFTLVELIVVAAIMGLLASMSIPAFKHFVYKVKVSRCNSEIRGLEKDIFAYTADKGVFPDSLNDIGRGDLRDPWGNLYQYANISSGAPPRINQFLSNLNLDFDLYSVGVDGLSQASITDATSADDIVRAGDGGWVGQVVYY